VATLNSLLGEIGYVEVSFTEKGEPRFPQGSGLQWSPAADWTLGPGPLRGAVMAPEQLRAGLHGLMAALPGCRAPLEEDTMLRRASAGKTLMLFPCEGTAPPAVVIASPAGFRQMHLPERLDGFDDRGAARVPAATQIVAVSDVDGDGRLEILTRRRVWTDTYEYDLSEESGDWFTYLTSKP